MCERNAKGRKKKKKRVKSYYSWKEKKEIAKPGAKVRQTHKGSKRVSEQRRGRRERERERENSI